MHSSSDSTDTLWCYKSNQFAPPFKRFLCKDVTPCSGCRGVGGNTHSPDRSSGSNTLNTHPILDWVPETERSSVDTMTRVWTALAILVCAETVLCFAGLHAFAPHHHAFAPAPFRSTVSSSSLNNIHTRQNLCSVRKLRPSQVSQVRELPEAEFQSACARPVAVLTVFGPPCSFDAKPRLQRRPKSRRKLS